MLELLMMFFIGVGLGMGILLWIGSGDSPSL